MSEEKPHFESKGFWFEREQSGEELVCFKVKNGGTRKDKKLGLAALTVERIKHNPAFARYFKSLLEG